MTDQSPEEQNYEAFIGNLTVKVFLHDIILQENLSQLREFVSRAGSKYEYFDPLELDELVRHTEYPITGVYHTISQWRFKDGLMPKVVSIPEGFELFVDEETAGEIEEFRGQMFAARRSEQEPVRIETARRAVEAYQRIYDNVYQYVSPSLKVAWLIREESIYLPLMGQQENLPGRLTPDYVDHRVEQLREVRQRFLSEDDTAHALAYYEVRRGNTNMN